MIKKEYEAGHSIGVHTFSHDFEKIYSAYFIIETKIDCRVEIETMETI